VNTAITEAADRVHAGLQELLDLTSSAQDLPAHVQVLQAVGGREQESIAGHLARVLEAVAATLQDCPVESVQEAGHWVRRSGDDLVDRVAGDGIERALDLLQHVAR